MVNTWTCLTALLTICLIDAALGMKLVTYNLRFDSLPNNITVQQSLDSLPDPLVEPQYYASSTEKPWSTRRLRVAQSLLEKGVVLAGFQEALVRQVRDLAELLGSDWGWVGVGRDDGVQAGEFSPIFYHKPSLTLLSNDTFWTSNTPFQPSRFPGAGSTRLCTAARFTLTEAGQSTTASFSVLNTHLDNSSDGQRRLAASMMLHRARYEAATHGGAVFVLGDFNSEPTGNTSDAYSIITGSLPPVAINTTFTERFPVSSNQLPTFSMLDLRSEAPRKMVSANYATFTGFSPFADTGSWSRIDFVFGGSNGGWTTNGYTVESALGDDGVYASDHRPVFVNVSLK